MSWEKQQQEICAVGYRIQVTVILEASKLWELARLFKLLPGIVCFCWQKHIFFHPEEWQWLYACAHYLVNSISPLMWFSPTGKLSFPTCLLHNPDVSTTEFTDTNFYNSTYSCFWKEAEVTLAFTYVDTILTFSLVPTLWFNSGRSLSESVMN